MAANLFLERRRAFIRGRIFMEFHMCEKYMGNMPIFRGVTASINQKWAKIFQKVTITIANSVSLL